MIPNDTSCPATAQINATLMVAACDVLIKELSAERDALDQAQIEKLAAEIICPGGWPWSKKFPRGMETAVDIFHNHFRSYMRDSRTQRWRIARAEKLLKVATTSGLSDIRIDEDDIFLLRPYLGASDIE